MLAEHPLESWLDLTPRRGRTSGRPLVFAGRPRVARRTLARALASRARLLDRILSERPLVRSPVRVAAMPRRATVPRLLTAGPALPFLEIGHHFLRSIGFVLNRAIAAV
jgi:hypothetical protein